MLSKNHTDMIDEGHKKKRNNYKKIYQIPLMDLWNTDK